MAQLRQVPLSEIEADGTFKYRCRDEQQASISRLAEDIKANGLLVPLLLKEMGQGKYLLVAGYRRYAALFHLCNEGGQPIGKVDAHVYPRGTPRKTLLAARFAENVERKNLSTLDLA